MLTQIAVIRIQEGKPDEVIVAPQTILVADRADAYAAVLVNNAEALKKIPRKEIEVVCLDFRPIRLQLSSR